MPSQIVVLANAPHTQAIAKRVSAELGELGFAVDPGAGVATRRAQAARIEAAHRVVVLWSRAARGTPALRAAVRRARAKGTLVCVALDAAPPSPGAAHRLPRSGGAWRKALAAKRARKADEVASSRAYPRPAKARRDAKLRGDKPIASAPAPRSRSRGASLLASLMALALIAAAAGTEAYARDPAFAARVHAFAGDAQARVSELATEFAAR